MTYAYQSRCLAVPVTAVVAWLHTTTQVGHLVREQM